MTPRLLRGIGANLYAQLVTSVIQLAAVPVLLRLWGPGRYGLWTLFSAMPAALAFADGGLVLATGTAMTMAVARHDVRLAAGLFRRAARTVGLVVLGAAVAVCGAASCLPVSRLAPGLPGGEARALLLLFALITLAGVLGSLPGAAFRADRRYAFGVVLSASLRAAELGAVLVAAAVAEGLVVPAMAWLAARMFGLALQGIVTWASIPWLRQRASWPMTTPHLGPLLRPALAAVALPAGFAVGLQGVTVAAGLVLAPEAVAAFATVRTLARLIVQLSGLVNHALMPEMARVAAQREQTTAAAMLRFSRAATAALLLPGWVMLLVAGPWLLAAWTGGRLQVAPAVLPLVATAALVHGLWLSRANLLLAVNRQADYAWMFLAVASLTALAAVPGARAAGLAGVAAATLGGEIAMALWILHVVRSRPSGAEVMPGAVLP